MNAYPFSQICGAITTAVAARRPGRVKDLRPCTGDLTGHDNDVEVSLTRTNAFGEQLHGSVVDVDGSTWQFSAGVQLRIDRNGEFHFITERFTLAGGH